MHFQYIIELLDLPEIRVVDISITDQKHVIIEVVPVEYIQKCPCCFSSSVKRMGIPYHRKVRHLSAFGKTVYLRLPAIRMQCKECFATFVWEYSFVGAKKRYTKQFESFVVQQASGSTIKTTADQQNVPYSTAERCYKYCLKLESERIQEKCLKDAANRDMLVLGIDDFAIRKGHKYNTGLHDLKGGSFLQLIPGRTYEELMDHYDSHPSLKDLRPAAVVMDLAKAYHAFIRTVYPNAIRIADRFHVNRYVTEALQKIRKQVQKTLAPHAKKRLKKFHHCLSKRRDDLSPEEEKLVNELLGYDKQLKAAYLWKENFIDWYDLSLNFKQAKIGFERWCEQGRLIGHPAVDACLKTMENWKEEIMNYHKLRFTNASVEGRNNKIKTLQRKHYFTRNPEVYKQRIIVECNKEYMRTA